MPKYNYVKFVPLGAGLNNQDQSWKKQSKKCNIIILYLIITCLYVSQTLPDRHHSGRMPFFDCARPLKNEYQLETPTWVRRQTSADRCRLLPTLVHVCVVPGARGLKFITLISIFVLYVWWTGQNRSLVNVSSNLQHICREGIIMSLLQLRVQVLATGLFVHIDIMLLESRQIHFFRRLLQLRAPGVSWLIYILSLTK